MQLRRRDTARGADTGDQLALAHLVTTLYRQPVVVGISANPTAGMFDQHQVAKPAQLIASINDNAIFHRYDRRTARRSNIDPIIT